MRRRSCNSNMIFRTQGAFLLCLILSTALIQILLLEQSTSNSGKISSDALLEVPLNLSRSSLQQGPIFYNLFVPNTKSRSERERIVKEQLLQRELTTPNATIHYTLIGDPTFNDFVSSQCTDCQLQENRNIGNEEHTLQSLWEYCQLVPETSVDILVTYIHNKGSYHPSDANEKARRMATKAAMECRNILPQNQRTCNICMGAFHIFPQYLASAK